MASAHRALERAAALLPHQGPIGVFIHHNTLAELEDLPFDRALERAARALGARVRLDEAEYREMMADGRIAPADLQAVHAADEATRPAEPAGDDGLPPSAELRWLVLLHGIEEEPWRVRAFRQSEGQDERALSRVPADARERLGQGAVRLLADAPDADVARLLASTDDLGRAAERVREQLGLGSLAEVRDRVLDPAHAPRLGFALLRERARERVPERRATDVPEPPDLEPFHEKVDELLLPVVAGALDLGQATWAPPEGPLWETGLAVLRTAPAAELRSWKRALQRELRRWEGRSPAEALNGVLGELDPTGARHEALLREVLHARPGWAGAVRWREHARGTPALVDYAALRLILLAEALRGGGLDPAAAMLDRSRKGLHRAVMADRVAHVLALAGVGPDEALLLRPHAWERARRVVLSADGGWRCRLLHEARERTSDGVFLGALLARFARGPREPAEPDAQVIFCLDEREESMRRALEEEGGARVSTFGAAGFFGLAIQYRGRLDAHGSNRCPVVVAPVHRVEEVALAPHSRGLRVHAWAGHRLDHAARSLAGGVVAALLAGPAVLLAAAGRMLAPRWSLALARRFGSLLAPSAPARLVAAREPRDPGPDLPIGFTPEEAADRVAAVLQAIGLDRFAPLVVVMGHGSTSLNNPHESAHDCGACGGFRGDGNARAFAALANDPEVREALAARGVRIPPETRFVGGYHDTASDEVRLWDDGVPVPGLDRLRADLEGARRAHARERARRFEQADPPSPEAALAHVEGRSADLRQVRPEYGHATNAILVVGPRALTRGLFLDRRAFLHSYEPGGDDEGARLERILGAAVPVCAGISLEYYFSRVDNERFGCGTKIPHNVVGLHGVVNGSWGDLRTGLPWQMVEIHEPVRLLVVVVCPPERARAVVGRLPAVRRLLEGRWIRLVAVEAGRAWRWNDGGFVSLDVEPAELPEVDRSAAWFLGRANALAPALVREKAP